MADFFESLAITKNINPLQQTETCNIKNNKKNAFYVHTYDPTTMIQMLLRTDFNHTVLDMFDTNIKTECCNVISISLYFTNCDDFTMDKYLESILRSVKNVKKNLNDWLVRVYLDKSVYDCIGKKAIDSKISLTFYEIIHSANVEVYTYLCESFQNKTIPIARTRTLRFLPLCDNEVNICIIREADGIVSNLDCHNIKMYSTMSDKLFYLPMVVHPYKHYNDNLGLLFDSYSLWLRLYKLFFNPSYFIKHQNIYDLLAGAFGIKLKIKKEYYFKKISELAEQIIKFREISENHKTSIYANVRIKGVFGYDTGSGLISAQGFDKIEELLNIGFDEILLLDMYKEIISFEVDKDKLDIAEKANKVGNNIKVSKYMFFQNIDEKIINKYTNIIIGDDIDIIHIDCVSCMLDLETKGKILREKMIIGNECCVMNQLNASTRGKITLDRDLFETDALLKNIIYKNPFNIQIGDNYVSQLLNMPYSRQFDHLYDALYDALYGGHGIAYVAKYKKYAKKNSEQCTF